MDQMSQVCRPGRSTLETNRRGSGRCRMGFPATGGDGSQQAALGGLLLQLLSAAVRIASAEESLQHSDH